MKVLHNNAYIVEDVAVCGTRGWLYNSETEEDVKIVNREVGRLVASLNDAAKQDANAQPIVFCIIRLYTEIWRVREFWMYWKHVMLNNAILGIFMATKHPKKAVRGNYHGIKMHLISCDYVNFMPILVK